MKNKFDVYFVVLSWFNEERNEDDKDEVTIAFTAADDVLRFTNELTNNDVIYQEYDKPYDVYVYGGESLQDFDSYGRSGMMRDGQKFLYAVFDLPVKHRKGL